jgi:hypothetical protein
MRKQVNKARRKVSQAAENHSGIGKQVLFLGAGIVVGTAFASAALRTRLAKSERSNVGKWR